MNRTPTAIQQSVETFRGQAFVEWEAVVLLLVSRGKLEEDFRVIKEAHSEAPDVPILLVGTTKESGAFLQCVRAGISGYLWKDASTDEVLEGFSRCRPKKRFAPAR